MYKVDSNLNTQLGEDRVNKLWYITILVYYTTINIGY